MAADDAHDDNALIERANRGDAAAFEALYFRHRDWVLTLAFRFTGNRDDALDVLQETFAYFFGKFPGFVLTASLKTFFYPTIKHLSLTRRRKQKATIDIDALADSLPDADPRRSPGAASDFATLVSTLPPPQREVVLLRFADDLRLDQIAIALSLPLGTVKSRLHNALETPRKRVRR